MQCVILAGGLATRMRPLTDTIPKSLIAIGGHPFLYYQLRWLVVQGITEVVLCIGHQGHRIKSYVEENNPWGLSVRFVDEGENLLGTAGALRLAAESGFLKDKFFVTYGDSFLPISFSKVWAAFEKSDKSALMTVFHNEGKWDSSNVEFENGQIKRYQKNPGPDLAARMNYIDYGLSILRRDVIRKEVPRGKKVDLASLFERLSESNDLEGYEVMTRFYEIGSPLGLADFSQFAQKNLGTLLEQQRNAL